MCSRLAYIYFNDIDTDNEGNFTVGLKNKRSNKAIEFFLLYKNKRYFITNLRINTALEEDIAKFRNYKDVIKNKWICVAKHLRPSKRRRTMFMI